MCEFCDGRLTEERLDVRTVSGDDNICEERDCEKCNGCCSNNQYFSVRIVCKDQLQLFYKHIIGSLVIAPISEGMIIKYCPMCGKDLSIT
jgi:hypothetical protein